MILNDFIFSMLSLHFQKAFFMNDYLFDFLKENLKDENSLIAFYGTFRGKLYIKDTRYELRKIKILELWEKYKKQPSSKIKIFKQIAKEVQNILPNTNHKQVSNIIRTF